MEVAHFSIRYYQSLLPEGKLVGDLPLGVTLEKICDIYRWMVLTRTFDTKAINLQRTGKMGTYASILGQEAISVTLGSLMQQKDMLAPAYREYGAQFQRGVAMSDILRYWGGDERGNAFNHPVDFPICVPIATQCLHAVGVAKAFQLRKEAQVAVSVCGDGATSQGDFYEAMNLAGVWKLPVVFLVGNNQWAISVPRHLQTAAQTLAQKAIAAGFDGVQVDGNDVIALHACLSEALEKARSGKGPTLVEALTYRLHDHTTADDASRYRAMEELESARNLEPIARTRRFLMDSKVWSEAQESGWLKECQLRVEQAVEDYMNTPPAPISDMFDYLYADIPDSLCEQRAIAQTFAERSHD